MSAESLRALACLWLSTVCIAVGCDEDHPGGSVGEACDDVGSTMDCEAEQICGVIWDGRKFCLAACFDDGDCDVRETCRSQSGIAEPVCSPPPDPRDRL